jgi:hypothetical protein
MFKSELDHYHPNWAHASGCNNSDYEFMIQGLTGYSIIRIHSDESDAMLA